MISIDTEVMRQLVSAANVTNSNITTAMELLTSISSHWDWACKEKDAINEYSAANKQKVRQLHENSQAFLSVLSSVAGEYESTENSISNMFSSVETLLSGILTVPSMSNGFSIIDPITPIAPVLQDILDDIMSPSVTNNYNPFDSFSIKTLLQPLSLCSFKDINLE